MGFFRQKYWSGLPFPSPGHLPNPGIEPCLLPWQADSVPPLHLGSPLCHSGQEVLNAGLPGCMGGGGATNSTARSDSHAEIGHRCLASIIWTVLSTVSLQFQVSVFPFLWGQFSESWLQCGHHVVNFFHLVGVSVSVRQLTGYGPEIYL